MRKFICAVTVLTIIIALTGPALAEWSGVDEAVVEKFAEEHGREAVDPVINTDQGDLLLFVFLLGGALGGFVGGYYWRVLNEPREGTPGTQDNAAG